MTAGPPTAPRERAAEAPDDPHTPSPHDGGRVPAAGIRRGRRDQRGLWPRTGTGSRSASGAFGGPDCRPDPPGAVIVAAASRRSRSDGGAGPGESPPLEDAGRREDVQYRAERRRPGFLPAADGAAAARRDRGSFSRTHRRRPARTSSCRRQPGSSRTAPSRLDGASLPSRRPDTGAGMPLSMSLHHAGRAGGTLFRRVVRRTTWTPGGRSHGTAEGRAV